MWRIVFVFLVIAFGFGIWYLISRVREFGFIRKAARENNKRTWLLAAIVTAVFLAAAILGFGLMNGIVIVIHLVVIWLICDLVVRIAGKISGRELKNAFTGAAAVLITAVYLSYGWYSAHKVDVTNYTISTDKNVGDLRIVQISDSHMGALFDAEKFGEYVREMQSENPDVVVITGDFVDDGTSREDMFGSCRALADFDTKYGVYYIYGNHDRGYTKEERRGWTNEEFVSALEESGVTILEDESILIDDRFYITGRMDYSVEEKGGSRADMQTLTENLDEDKFSIVLDHQPRDYDAQAESGADLVLSGHTHGGQFFPIIKAGEWMGVNCLTYGIEKRGDTSFIVSSGIADWEIDFKTGCKSEYVVIDVRGE
ncbi:MAG: metallophosphoesterase [Porcipelethomonas sp.]